MTTADDWLALARAILAGEGAEAVAGRLGKVTSATAERIEVQPTDARLSSVIVHTEAGKVTTVDIRGEGLPTVAQLEAQLGQGRGGPKAHWQAPLDYTFTLPVIGDRDVCLIAYIPNDYLPKGEWTIRNLVLLVQPKLW